VFAKIFCKILLLQALKNIAFQLLVNELLLELLFAQYWTRRHINAMYKSSCYQWFIQLCFSRSSYIEWHDKMIIVLNRIWPARKRSESAKFEVLAEVLTNVPAFRDT